MEDEIFFDRRLDLVIFERSTFFRSLFLAGVGENNILSSAPKGVSLELMLRRKLDFLVFSDLGNQALIDLFLFFQECGQETIVG